ncbi:hypothetical protein SNEBB_003162 [Seison nebaliae]|nr:hypothetical protein SNEBB_003162 [Seison nebaliae]
MESIFHTELGRRIQRAERFGSQRSSNLINLPQLDKLLESLELTGDDFRRKKTEDVSHSLQIDSNFNGRSIYVSGCFGMESADIHKLVDNIFEASYVNFVNPNICVINFNDILQAATVLAQLTIPTNFDGMSDERTPYRIVLDNPNMKMRFARWSEAPQRRSLLSRSKRTKMAQVMDERYNDPTDKVIDAQSSWETMLNSSDKDGLLKNILAKDEKRENKSTLIQRHRSPINDSRMYSDRTHGRMSVHSRISKRTVNFPNKPDSNETDFDKELAELDRQQSGRRESPKRLFSYEDAKRSKNRNYRLDINVTNGVRRADRERSNGRNNISIMNDNELEITISSNSIISK